MDYCTALDPCPRPLDLLGAKVPRVVGRRLMGIVEYALQIEGKQNITKKGEEGRRRTVLSKAARGT